MPLDATQHAEVLAKLDAAVAKVVNSLKGVGNPDQSALADVQAARALVADNPPD